MKKLWPIAGALVIAVVVSEMIRSGPKPEFKLRVQTSADGLLLTNGSDVDFRDCTVLINSRFQREGVSLPRSKAVNVPAASLIGDAGRFQPDANSADRIHVLCHEPAYVDALFKVDG